MRKSCLVQLILLVLVAVILGLSARRLFPSSSSRTTTQIVAESATKPAASSLTRKILALVAGGAVEPTLPPSPPQASGMDSLELLLSRPVILDIPRIEGLALDADYLFVSGYDPERQAAFVFQLAQDTRAIAQVRQIQAGGRYLIGGLAARDGILWTALVGSEPEGGSTVMGLSTASLEPLHQFVSPAAIAAVAPLPQGTLAGITETGEAVYVWNREGNEIAVVPLASGARYQDLEVINGSLVCAGLDSQGGVIDVLDSTTFSLLVRHRCQAAMPNGLPMTSGGLGYWDGIFFFLPTAGHWPHVLSYQLTDGALPDYVPPSVGVSH
jgi:hypothetical protein